MTSTMNGQSAADAFDLFDDDVSVLTGFASAGHTLSADETDNFGFPTACTNKSSNKIELAPRSRPRPPLAPRPPAAGAGEGAGGAKVDVKEEQEIMKTPPRPSPTNSLPSSPTSVVKFPTSRANKDNNDSTQRAVDRSPPRTDDDGGNGRRVTAGEAPDPPGDSATVAVAETMIPPTPPPRNSPRGAQLAYMLAKASYDAMQDKMLREKRAAAAEAAKRAMLEKEEERKKIGSTDDSTLYRRSRSEVETESFIEEIESVHTGNVGGEATSSRKRAGAEAGGSGAAVGLATTFEEEALANEAAFGGDSGDANGANGGDGVEADAVSPLTVPDAVSPLTVPTTTQENDEEGAGAGAGAQGVDTMKVVESSSTSVNSFACCGTVLPEGGDDDEDKKSSGFDLGATMAELDRFINGLASPSSNHLANRSVAASAGNAGNGAGGDDTKAAIRALDGTNLVATIPKTGPIDVDEVSQSSLVEEINAQSGSASSGLLVAKDEDQKKNQETEKDASLTSVTAAAAAAVVPIAAKMSMLSDGVSKGGTEASTKKSKTKKKVTIAERIDEKCFNDTIEDVVDSGTISDPDPIPTRNSNKSDCSSHHTDDASTVVSLQFKVEKKKKTKTTKKPAPISREASSTTVKVDNTTGGKGLSNGGSSRKTAFRSLKKKLSNKKLASASSVVSSMSVVDGGPDATIRMISGCDDSKAADNVQNTSSFTIPYPSGMTGGACTSSLLQVLYDAEGGKAKAAGASKKKREGATSKLSYVDILTKMRSDLKNRGYDQIPQLTASQPVDIAAPFRLKSGKGTARALLVGINYVGEENQLSGCHNDVRNMHRYLTEVAGFDADNVTMLMDDGDCPLPSKANIIEAWKELAEDSKAGDSVFFHFSGHGGRVRDSNRSEKDSGHGETIVPADYKNAGQICDDDMYNALCKKMPKGVIVTCLMDSCHSGTVLDLPYVFKADGTDIRPKAMKMNKGFDSSKFFFGDTFNQMIAESSNGFCTPPRRSSNGRKVASSPSTPTTNSSACDDDLGDDAATMVSI